MGNFAMDVDRFKALSLGQVVAIARKIVLTAYRRIILRTPVKTGRARGNWICTINAPARMTEGIAAVNDTDKTGGATVSAMATEVLGWPARTGASVFMTNNLPYIGKLEHGSSDQAPNGMVALTITELGGIARDAAAEAQAMSWGGAQAAGEMGSAWNAGGASE